MLSYLSLFITLICFWYYYFTRTYNYWKSKNVKGPKPIPFFGNYKDVAFRKKHVGMLYNDIYKQYPEERVIGLYRMTVPTLLICDLDIVKQVMIKDFPLFPDRATYYSKEGLGQNMFHSDRETWKLLKNEFSSVLTTSKLKNLFNLIVDCGDEFVDYMEDVTLKNPEHDVYQKVLKYTISTAMAALLGMKIDTFSNDIKLFEIIDDKLKTHHFNELEMIIPGFLIKCNASILYEETIKFCHEIIETSKNLQQANKTSPCNVMDVIMNLADKLNMNGKNHSCIEITAAFLAAQVWVFFTAGYANNTLSLTYAMYHLARNIDVQNKLIEEIDEVMDRHKHKLTYEALKEMKYLDRVFLETLRIHPPTNGLVRSVAEEVRLEGLELTIDKDTVVVVSPYAIHHDEKYYPEPERFDPDRFLPENVKHRHPYSFLTFGIGRRSCLGSQLAKLQFGACVAQLFTKFRVETTENTVSNIKFDPWRLLLSPQEKIWLKFVRR